MWSEANSFILTREGRHKVIWKGFCWGNLGYIRTWTWVMWTLCGMDWVLGSSGFWIKQRWLKTLHHQSQTIKGQTRFKSLPHYFPEPCSLGRGLFPCKIIFFSIHTVYFSAQTLHIFLAQVSASKTDCFLFLDVISVSWSRQRLYLPIAMCQAVLTKNFL